MRRLLAPLLLLVLVAGCGLGGPRNYENENDRLRRLVLELEDQVEALRAERDELRAKVAEAHRAAGSPLPEEVLEALPRVAGIRIDRLSGLADADEPGRARLVVYVKPYDARQRFVQATGRLVVEAFAIPGGGEPAQPRRLADASLSPGELRDAYRYDFTGQYYSVAIPLDEPPDPGATLVIRARLEDALTGLSHEAERILER